MRNLTDEEKGDMRAVGWSEEGIKDVEKDVAIDSLVCNFLQEYASLVAET